MAIFRSKVLPLCLAMGIVVIGGGKAATMGVRPDNAVTQFDASSELISKAEPTKLTICEVGQILWPVSDSTRLQQEEILKKLIGKRVNWQIIVAQVQRDGGGYLIQGQSDKNMVGTFSYVFPHNEIEKNTILNASIGSRIDISGVVDDIHLRHVVIRPAMIVIKGEE